MAYAEALGHYGDVGGYDLEVVWDKCHHRRDGDALRPRPLPRC